MEANKILQSDILDILFEGKNKLYGAYELRKTYNNRLKKALFSTGSLLLLILIGTVLAGAGTKNKNTINVGDDITIVEVDHVSPPPPIKILPPPAAIENQVRFTKPIVVTDDKVRQDEKLQDITEDQVISSQTIKSDVTDHIIQAPVIDQNSTITEVPVKKNEEPAIYTTVQIPAGFPGGFPAWKKYLENNLDPETALNNGAPEGTYTVIVRFVVSKDGSISEVAPETDLGYGLETEAIKIIKNGPKWIPAIQNGQKVNAYHRQPIIFVVTGQ